VLAESVIGSPSPASLTKTHGRERPHNENTSRRPGRTACLCFHCLTCNVNPQRCATGLFQHLAEIPILTAGGFEIEDQVFDTQPKVVQAFLKTASRSGAGVHGA